MKITIIFDVPGAEYRAIQNQDMHGSDIHDDLMDHIRSNFYDYQEDVYLTQLTPPGELEKELMSHVEWIIRCVNQDLIDLPDSLYTATKKLNTKCRKATRARLKR